MLPLTVDRNVKGNVQARQLKAALCLNRVKMELKSLFVGGGVTGCFYERLSSPQRCSPSFC